MTRVFLHGLGQNADDWMAVQSHLTGNFETVTPDLSALLRTGDGTYNSLLQSVSAECCSLPGPLDLCGLSLGSVLALHHAILYPNQLHSLVLIAPQVRMPRRLLAFQNALFRLLPERLVTGGTVLGKKELLTLTRSMTKLDLTAGLSSVICPTLVICGQRDRANRRAAEDLAAALPRAKLWIAPAAGHQVNLEAPQALAEALNAFWCPLQ